MKVKTSPFQNIYKSSLSLLTDLYQLTMAYAYWKNNMEQHEAVFHLFFRRPPFKGGFTVAAGLEHAIHFIENFKFDKSDLDYLSRLKDDQGETYFSSDFLEYLSELKLECEIDAVPEGTIVFPYEPLIRVKGPIIQAQLLESPLLNLINFPTLIATKAARTCIAAKGDPILEFGLRRAPGIDGALTASRAAYIGGCSSTSNVLAGKLFDIPVKGTHSHSWVMAFDEEVEAFQAFVEAMPNHSVFLVDTFDTIEGIKKAIHVGNILKSKGKKLLGVRLDSGDLADLSIKGRKMLDKAGFPDAKIYASNELDETIISELKRQGAQINIWGVGTNLVNGQTALDGVYKLSAIRKPNEEWKPKLKLSEQLRKVSDPGVLQIRRFYTEKGNVADMIYDVNSDIESQEKGWTIVDPFDSTKHMHLANRLKMKDLLVPIFRNGKNVYSLPTIHEIQKNTHENLKHFDVGIKRFINPHQYMVGMEKSHYYLKLQLIREIREKQIQDVFAEEES